MRKNVVYSGLLLLMGVMAACSSHENLDTGHDKQVRLGIDIDRGAQSRAATPIPPENYALRCIIEIWNSEGTSVIHREEQLITDGNAFDFNFDLEEIGSYPAFAWADYVEADASNTSGHYPDYYYATDSEKGLKEISIIEENYAVNALHRDAFYAHWTIHKEEAAYVEEITLKRPFAQINIIENETTLLTHITGARFIYSVPGSFNTEEGIPGDALIKVDQTITTLPATSPEYNANLLYDYIFASTATGTLASDIQIHFTPADTEKALHSLTIPGNSLPLVSNHRTNARGTMLHFTTEMNPAAQIVINVDSVWEDENDYGLPNNTFLQIPLFINHGNPFEQL